MSEKICGTAVSVETVEKALQNYFGGSCPKLEGVTSKQIAAGEGFTSKIIRVELKWRGETPQEFIKSVILKAPAVESLDSVFEKFSGGVKQNLESMVKLVEEAMNTESIAYNLLGPLDIVPMPKCYAYEISSNTSPGFILLEDLGPKASISLNVDVPLNLKQVLNVVKIVANLHAWSLCTDKPLSKYFNKMEDTRESSEIVLESFKNGVSSMKKSFPNEFKDVNEEKVLPFFEFDNYLKVNNSFIGVIPPVLVHGDFWSNNVMFKLGEDGKITDDVYAVIDWQTCYLGNCMTDFGRLFTFFPMEFLEAHMGEILRTYYEILKSKCGAKLSTNFDEIKKLYEEQYAINVLQLFSMANVAIASETENVEAVSSQLVQLTQEHYKMAAKILKL